MTPRTCRSGHELTPETTTVTREGRTRCLICRREQSRRYRRRNRAALAAAFVSPAYAHERREILDQLAGCYTPSPIYPDCFDD